MRKCDEKVLYYMEAKIGSKIEGESPCHRNILRKGTKCFPPFSFSTVGLCPTTPQVEWSEIAKETFLQEVKRQVLLNKLDKIFEHSELTDEDALRLGEKVKEAGYKKYLQWCE